jgi:hypothetical protein
MGFQIFKYLDTALVKQESREPRSSSVPAVWPSEASAEKIDKSENKIVGSCHRKSYLRMIGWPVTNNVDAVGAWKWVTGRRMEEDIVSLAKASSPRVYVASGVRFYVPDLYLPLELDLVAMDPETNQGWICECKTYYGYLATSEIVKKGQPKLTNLLQDVIYLLEAPNGKRMKEIIRKSLEDRARLDAKGVPHRNRVECDLEALGRMSDGPIGAKLVYVDRGTCDRTEFDISVEEDFDGSHYPQVNGDTYKTFPVESVYSRYQELQGYWFRARQAGVDNLAARGVQAPATLRLVLKPGDDSQRDEDRQISSAELEAERAYLRQLDDEVLKLPDSFWPPAEFEWAYPQSKIERLYAAGSSRVSKTKYNKLQKKQIDRIGDWECYYCNYKNACVPKQNPNWTYMLYDIAKAGEEEEA